MPAGGGAAGHFDAPGGPVREPAPGAAAIFDMIATAAAATANQSHNQTETGISEASVAKPPPPPLTTSPAAKCTTVVSVQSPFGAPPDRPLLAHNRARWRRSGGRC